MIDTELIKSTTSCRDAIQRDLGKPVFSAKNYDAYRCPLHNESKGCSFVVYDDHWKCFGKCDTSGDVIKWYELYHDMSFRMACRHLAAGHLPTTTRKPPRPKPPPQPEPDRPPPAAWQNYADKLIHQATENLWSHVGVKALNYLIQSRGLGLGTILSARLGYIPAMSKGDFRSRVIYPDWRKDDGKVVKIPVGITIPSIADGHIWSVKVRRAVQPKYLNVPGGSKALYGFNNVMNGLPLFIVEGEFDKLVLDHVAPGIVSSVALGSASNHHIDERWWSALTGASQVLVRMDDDRAGKSALSSLQSLMPGRVQAIQVPNQHKDINDFLLADGQSAVLSWIQEWVEVAS